MIEIRSMALEAISLPLSLLSYVWSGKSDLNRQPMVWKTIALPIELFPRHFAITILI